VTLDSRAIGDEAIKRDRVNQDQLAAARALVGKRVIWAHHRGDMFAKNMRVECSTADGLVCVEGFTGEFAPHCFVVV
jgi:hypothetical protein